MGNDKSTIKDTNQFDVHIWKARSTKEETINNTEIKWQDTNSTGSQIKKKIRRKNVSFISMFQQLLPQNEG